MTCHEGASALVAIYNLLAARFDEGDTRAEEDLSTTIEYMSSIFGSVEDTLRASIIPQISIHVPTRGTTKQLIQDIAVILFPFYPVFFLHHTLELFYIF